MTIGSRLPRSTTGIARWVVTAAMLAGCGGAGALEDVARSEGSVVSPDVSIFYRVVGSGSDTVIVVPGGPGRPMDYLGSAIVPLRARATWILYDPRGTGRSLLSANHQAIGLANDVTDLEAVRVHFGLSRLSLLGHGTGAAIAAHYAARYPTRVRRLVLVSPYPVNQGFVWAWQLLDRDTSLFSQGARSYPESRGVPGARGYCRRFWFWYFQPVFTVPVPERAAAEAVCQGPDSSLVDPAAYQLAWLATATGHDWRGTLDSITAPTLVVEGVSATARQLFQVHAEEWARVIQGARVLAIRGGALLPWLTNPGDFQAGIAAFLGGGWPAGAYRPPVGTTTEGAHSP